MKNIAVLVPTLENGGMERVASQLSRILSDNGNNVFVFVLSLNRKKAYSVSGRIVRCYINICSTTKIKEVISYYLSSISIKEYKKKYNINTTISFGQEMNLLNIFSNVSDKKILTVHNCMSLRDDIKGITNRKPWVCLWGLAYKIVTVCEWVKNDLINNYGINKNKITVIYNPAVIKEDDRNDLYEVGEKEYILTVGRLENIKAQWHLIKVMKVVSNKYPKIKMLIAGDGPNKRNLQMLIHKLGLERNVELIGYVKDIERYYRRAKILVMSSSSEAFPCAVIEALSYGIPVIASDFPGGIRECMGYNEKTDFSKYPIKMNTGLLTKNFSEIIEPYSSIISSEEYEMGKAIITLLEDKGMYNEFSSRCSKEVSRFSESVITKQWISLIQ